MTIAQFPVLRHSSFQFQGALTNVDAELWTEMMLPMLVISLVAIIITLGICWWWYSRSKVLYRRAVVAHVVGNLTFGVGTLFSSFAAVANSFDPVAYAAKAAIWEGKSADWGGTVPYIFRAFAIADVLSALLVAAAYVLAFRLRAHGPPA